MGNINIPSSVKILIEDYMEQNGLHTKGETIIRLLSESRELEALKREIVLLRRENEFLRSR